MRRGFARKDRHPDEDEARGVVAAAIVAVDEPRPGVVEPIAQDSFILRPDGSFVGE